MKVMRVVLYARVSTAKQADKDLSLPAQISRMRKYCDLRGHEIVQEYEERGASARDENRPVFLEMMQDILNGDLEIGQLLVLTTSRFFRNSLGAKEWKKKLKAKGIRVVAVEQETSDDFTGELAEHIFEGMDEHYSKQLAVSTLAGLRQNAVMGYFNGSRPPFGFRLERTRDQRGNGKSRLAVDSAESDVVKSIFKIYVEGINGRPIGLRNLSVHLNEMGLRHRNNRPWRKDDLERMFSNSAYHGEYIYNRWGKSKSDSQRIEKPREDWIIIPITPIVSKELYEAVQRKRVEQHPSRNHGGHSSSPMLLAQLARCGTCGSHMTLATGKGYRYYVCTSYTHGTVKSCPGNRTPEQVLDSVVLDHLCSRVLDSVNFRSLVVDFARKRKKSRPDIKAKLAAVDAEIAEMKGRTQKLLDAIEEGKIDHELVSERLRANNGHLVSLERKKENLWHQSNPEIPPHLYRAESLEKAREWVSRALRDPKEPVAKKLLRFLVKEVVVDGDQIRLVGKKAAMASIAAQEEKNACVNHLPAVIARGIEWLREQDSNLRHGG